jgi:hypothetical protein
MNTTNYREPELVEQVDLCLPGGRLNSKAIGWSRHPFHRCNLSRPWFSKKRWNFWAVSTGDHIFLTSISNRDYIGRSFVEYGNIKEGRLVGAIEFVPFGRGLIMPDTVQDSASFQHPNLSIFMDQTPGRVKISVKAREVDQAPFSAEFAIEYPKSHETLSVVVPWSEKRYWFTSKHNCLPASGWVRIGSEEIVFDGPQCFAVHDFGRGVLPRKFTWNWGSASGLKDGRTIGLNFGGNWTDGTGMTENAICINGRLTKVSQDLLWEYDRNNWMKPWRIQTQETNQIDLKLTPQYEKVARHRMGPLYIDVHQMFGFFEGAMVTGDGERIVVNDLRGWVEDVDGLW